MKVLVIGKNGIGLMPTTPRKARLLLKAHRAEVVRKVPFTIRLKYKTGCAHQDVSLGVDTGSQHIGIGITAENRGIDKAEYELRLTMEKRKLLETRKTYRRGRRFRNTPYRHPKFRHCTKRVYVEKAIKRNGHMTHWKKVPADFTSNREEGWLPPSIESKVAMHIQIIDAYMQALPLGTHLTIEMARFDIAKIKDPTLSGTDYQYGRLYEYENIKAYVFERDGYKCKCCGRKAGSMREDGSVVKLRAHHIDFRSEAATDNPDRMISVCDRCHTPEAHQPGGILYQWMLEGRTMKRGYRDMTFMNILAKRLRKAFPGADATYGNITNANRKLLTLGKSHANDGVAIALHDYIITTGDLTIEDADSTTYYKQIRRKKRSLHEANPRKGKKEPNRMAKRNAKNTKCSHGLYINDSIELNNTKGWVQSFCGSSETRLVDKDGNYITTTDRYTQVSISKVKYLHHNGNWRVYINEDQQ